MIWYETKWKKADKQAIYKTKSLTDYHKHIHQVCDQAQTLMLDSSVEWPFGLYAEIIAIGDKSKPERNKPFPAKS